MSGLENMRKRVEYYGGQRQIERMNEDKLRSLKKALLYSYQSATAILADGREFRCLINPDQIKNQYDNKYISIPFEDICLNERELDPSIVKPKKTSEGLQVIGMKPGDVFTWKENGTDWLVYLRRLEETAYFRAEIRRCKYTVDVDGTEYKCYAARPLVNEIDWRNQQDKAWNDIDYALEMYITKDEKTEAFFHRFTKVKINGKPWEVQSIDNMSSEGIIIMYLKEWYQNTIEEKVQQENLERDEEVVENPGVDGPSYGKPFIYGENHMLPYTKGKYIVVDAEGGQWSLGSDKGELINPTEFETEVYIKTGRSGKLELKYIRENEEEIVFTITIDSL